MATIRILLLLFCFAPVFGNWLPERNMLSIPNDIESAAGPMAPGFRLKGRVAGQPAAATVIRIAEKELGVRELTGHNDGPRVEAYLQHVGLKKGYAWCAAFVSWTHGQAGYAKPKSAWSPDLFPASKRCLAAQPAAVLGIYFPALKRIAHVGLVTGIRHDWVESVEGNTNAAGSREGDGVYRRLRHKRLINAYALYL